MDTEYLGSTGFGVRNLIDRWVNSTPPIGDIYVNAAWADPLSRQSSNRRTADRLNVALPARLTWKDQRGSTRFASVLTRDISEFGVFVECQSPISITQFRLVQFQLERDVRHIPGIPDALRQGRLLSAVYRIVQPTRSGGRQGLALRLLVDPRRRAKNDASLEAPLDLVASVGLAADLPLVTV